MGFASSAVLYAYACDKVVASEVKERGAIGYEG